MKYETQIEVKDSIQMRVLRGEEGGERWAK